MDARVVERASPGCAACSTRRRAHFPHRGAMRWSVVCACVRAHDAVNGLARRHATEGLRGPGAFRLGLDHANMSGGRHCGHPGFRLICAAGAPKGQSRLRIAAPLPSSRSRIAGRSTEPKAMPGGNGPLDRDSQIPRPRNNSFSSGAWRPARHRPMIRTCTPAFCGGAERVSRFPPCSPVGLHGCRLCKYRGSRRPVPSYDAERVGVRGRSGA